MPEVADNCVSGVDIKTLLKSGSSKSLVPICVARHMNKCVSIVAGELLSSPT